MSKRPRADDDDDFNCCLGTGSIGQLKDRSSRGKRVQRPIGFVHFPERRENKPAKRPKPSKPKRRKI